MMSYFFIQVNNKLDIIVQSVISIMVYGVKHVFEKSMVQNVIKNII